MRNFFIAACLFAVCTCSSPGEISARRISAFMPSLSPLAREDARRSLEAKSHGGQGRLVCRKASHPRRVTSKSGIVQLRGAYGTYLTQLERETKEKQAGLRSLYDDAGAFDEGYIDVDEPHSIYYRVYGANKTTTRSTALFLHGGPGAGCFPNHARFFDPEHYRVVLFDQRGCGRSTPKGAVRSNDIEALVRDIEALREHLGLERFDLVLGGSWGVTLAMAYAQQHPSRVCGMVLRGVCLFREREIGWLFAPGGGASILNPRGYADFTSTLSEEEIAGGLQGVLGAYARDLMGQDTAARDAASKRWSSWEFSMSSFARQFSGSGGSSQGAGVVEWEPSSGTWLVDGRSEEEVRKEFLSKLRRPSPAPNASSPAGAQNLSNTGGVGGGANVPAQAMLTCFYSLAPLPDAHLLSRIDSIRHIPCIAVQGSADLICPPGTAYDLHEAWPEMRLKLVNGAGHSMYDAGIASELIKATDSFRRPA